MAAPSATKVNQSRIYKNTERRDGQPRCPWGLISFKFVHFARRDARNDKKKPSASGSESRNTNRATVTLLQPNPSPVQRNPHLGQLEILDGKDNSHVGPFVCQKFEQFLINYQQRTSSHPNRNRKDTPRSSKGYARNQKTKTATGYIHRYAAYVRDFHA